MRLDFLDRPYVWEGTRIALDAMFGLYRRRLATLRRWGLLEGHPSVIDIGCGIGQYAAVTDGEYLGIDLNPRYIEYAQHRRGGPRRSFRQADARTIGNENHRFDIVLMVDFLHHLPDDTCHELLEHAVRLARRHVVSFEPVEEQGNRVGRWIIDNDRGHHMRPLIEFERLVEAAPLRVDRHEGLRLGPIGTRAVLATPSH